MDYYCSCDLKFTTPTQLAAIFPAEHGRQKAWVDLRFSGSRRCLDTAKPQWLEDLLLVWGLYQTFMAQIYFPANCVTVRCWRAKGRGAESALLTKASRGDWHNLDPMFQVPILFLLASSVPSLCHGAPENLHRASLGPSHHALLLTCSLSPWR